MKEKRKNGRGSGLAWHQNMTKFDVWVQYYNDNILYHLYGLEKGGEFWWRSCLHV